MNNNILIEMKKTIGGHLRHIRENNGDIPVNIMNIPGLDFEKLQQIENGDFNSAEDLLLISYVLNMTIGDILSMLSDCDCVKSIVTFNRILCKLFESNRKIVLETLKTLCEALNETQKMD